MFITLWIIASTVIVLFTRNAHRLSFTDKERAEDDEIQYQQMQAWGKLNGNI